jgi:hypothetical protein
MFPHSMPPSTWKESFNWKDFWDETSHVGQIIGLCAAGVWAYFNFVKSRTYYPRMDIAISGHLRSKGSERYLIPRVTLRNIGNSKVTLPTAGSGLKLWIAKGDFDETGNLLWSEGHVVHDIFDHDDWIEPGVTITNETNIFRVPIDCVAFKIQVRLVAKVGWPERSTAWISSAIVGPSIETDEEGYDPESE